MERRLSRTLATYFTLSYGAVLATLLPFLQAAARGDAIAVAFALSVYLTYAVLYLAPIIAATYALYAVLGLMRVKRVQTLVTGGMAVCGTALLEVCLYADGRLYQLYGFHLNGMVWNLLTTRGGVESLDSGEATLASFATVALGFWILQAGLLFSSHHWFGGFASARFLRFRRVRFALLALVVLVGFEHSTYAFAYATHDASVLAAAEKFPYYVPTRAREMSSLLGLGVAEGSAPTVEPSTGRIHYPLHEIEREPHRAYNIVWLVAESLRADALDVGIMPETFAFANRSQWYRTHYSGGNCTRMGVFSMFYGLHGAYWFPFHDQERGPVLMDVMIDDAYQFDLRTSARFSYPEFDETVFARAPRERMHEAADKPGWRSDEVHVGRMLDFISARDPKRPFMTFLFLESPHARYQFPPESVIRRPYLEQVNYATMDLARDVELIRNRYLNSVHHLDGQLGRVFAYLDVNGLLDSTIVVVTGDHGEEFMEKGRWGHGSGFSEEQTRVPLVLRIPGRPPAQIDRMTSHLDIAPTLLSLLGVVNPSSDYSLGLDLLDGPERTSTVVSGWNELVIIADDHKIVFPVGRFDGSLRSRVTTREDADVSLPEVVLSGNRPRVLGLLSELRRFVGSRS